MNRQAHPSRRARRCWWEGHGFSLVELLVSMAVLILITLALVAVTDSTGRLWSYTTSQIEQFRDAREAFETVTRRLSEATLNTYWDYNYPSKADGSYQAVVNPALVTAPTYVRQSELRFISGRAATLIDAATPANASTHPGHAVFFQAPLGQVNNAATYSNLDNLLNTWGFFVEYGDDSASRPDFVASLNPPIPLRYRFRVMEMREPSESLTLYSGPPTHPEYSTSGRPFYNRTDWFSYPLLSSTPRPARVLAENVLALVILPKLSPADEAALTPAPAVPGTALSPTYSYDSTLTYNGTTAPATANAAVLNPKNQLPPVVQVTMIAVDESSFARSQPPAARLLPDPLFADSTGTPLFSDATKYAADLQSLENTLNGQNTAYRVKLNYRVFTTNIAIKSAKWSRNQQN